MSTEENKALVRRYLETAWNKKDLSVVDQVVASDFVQRAANVPPGQEGVKRFFQMLYGGMPDAHFELQDIIAEGDKVSTRFRVTGTHQGTLLGIPASANKIDFTGMAMLIVRDGKIRANWNELDMATALRQMGVIPGP